MSRNRITEALSRAWTIFLSERSQKIAERHVATCNVCSDAQYVEVFRAVAQHVNQLRGATKGMGEVEASDFIATHLHAASMRSMLGFQEKFNELVGLVSRIESVMTQDQQAQFERLKAFAKEIN